MELDITKPLIHEVIIDIQHEKGDLEKLVQKVEYEKIPEFCNHCKSQGHSDRNCRRLHPNLNISSTQPVLQQDSKKNHPKEGNTSNNTNPSSKMQIDPIRPGESDKIQNPETLMECEILMENEGRTTINRGKGKRKMRIQRAATTDPQSNSNSQKMQDLSKVNNQKCEEPINHIPKESKIPFLAINFKDIPRSPPKMKIPKSKVASQKPPSRKVQKFPKSTSSIKSIPLYKKKEVSRSKRRHAPIKHGTNEQKRDEALENPSWNFVRVSMVMLQYKLPPMKTLNK